MSENTEIRSALELLAAEPLTEQIDYYRKPFMVLWAAIQEAASDVAEDYDLPADMAQLWVAEQMRQVADSLVDRLAEKAVAHGASKSNVARAAGASPAKKHAKSRLQSLQGGSLNNVRVIRRRIKVSNTFATLPVMAGDDVPAGPVDPIFNRLLKDRIIWMGEEVKDDMANRICAQLLMLAAEDPKKDIWLYINSPGGSITAGMAIYDTMQLIEPDVATVGLGMCASMGQFLLSSGTKGKRYLTSHARVLMHQPSGGIGGTATDVRINAELIMDMKKTMSELTAEQTGHTLEEIYRDNEYDHWFTAQEALDYGFVDKLVTTPDTIGNNQQGE